MVTDVSGEAFAYGDYLGVANRIGLPLTLAWIGLVGAGVVPTLRHQGGERILAGILLGALVGSLAGLLWFTRRLFLGNGIQPVYILQIVPVCAILTALGWARLREWSTRFSTVAFCCYLSLSLCLAPLFITHVPKPSGLEKISAWINGLFFVPLLLALPLVLLSFWGGRSGRASSKAGVR